MNPTPRMMSDSTVFPSVHDGNQKKLQCMLLTTEHILTHDLEGMRTAMKEELHQLVDVLRNKFPMYTTVINEIGKNINNWQASLNPTYDGEDKRMYYEILYQQIHALPVELWGLMAIVLAMKALENGEIFKAINLREMRNELETVDVTDTPVFDKLLQKWSYQTEYYMHQKLRSIRNAVQAFIRLCCFPMENENTQKQAYFLKLLKAYEESTKAIRERDCVQEFRYLFTAFLVSHRMIKGEIPSIFHPFYQRIAQRSRYPAIPEEGKDQELVKYLERSIYGYITAVSETTLNDSAMVLRSLKIQALTYRQYDVLLLCQDRDTEPEKILLSLFKKACDRAFETLMTSPEEDSIFEEMAMFSYFDLHLRRFHDLLVDHYSLAVSLECTRLSELCWQVSHRLTARYERNPDAPHIISGGYLRVLDIMRRTFYQLEELQRNIPNKDSLSPQRLDGLEYTMIFTMKCAQAILRWFHEPEIGEIINFDTIKAFLIDHDDKPTDYLNRMLAALERWFLIAAIGCIDELLLVNPQDKRQAFDKVKVFLAILNRLKHRLDFHISTSFNLTLSVQQYATLRDLMKLLILPDNNGNRLRLSLPIGNEQEILATRLNVFNPIRNFLQESYSVLEEITPHPAEGLREIAKNTSKDRFFSLKFIRQVFEHHVASQQKQQQTRQRQQQQGRPPASTIIDLTTGEDEDGEEDDASIVMIPENIQGLLDHAAANNTTVPAVAEETSVYGRYLRIWEDLMFDLPPIDDDEDDDEDDEPPVEMTDFVSLELNGFVGSQEIVKTDEEEELWEINEVGDVDLPADVVEAVEALDEEFPLV